MDLQKTVKVNLQILHLIETKYQDPPSLWPKGVETRYYAKLLQHTHQAVDALRHGGLAPPQQDPNP